MACCLCEKEKPLYHKIENSGRVVCSECVNGISTVIDLQKKVLKLEITTELLDRLYRNLVEKIISELSEKGCC